MEGNTLFLYFKKSILIKKVILPKLGYKFNVVQI